MTLFCWANVIELCSAPWEIRGLLNSQSHVAKEHRTDGGGTSAAVCVSTFWRMLDFCHLLKMPILAYQLC
jgi:hypothetical protein